MTYIPFALYKDITKKIKHPYHREEGIIQLSASTVSVSRARISLLQRTRIS